MFQRHYLWFFLSLGLMLLISCEQAPGEITGRVSYASGRWASVRIKVIDKKGKVVWEGTSDIDGTWYTRNVIPPGTYTVMYLDRDDKPFEGKEQEVTMDPGGQVVLEQTL